MPDIQQFIQDVERLHEMLPAVKAIAFGGADEDVEFEGETKPSLSKRLAQLLSADDVLRALNAATAASGSATAAALSSSQIAALIAGKTYANTTAGLAATTSGQAFLVTTADPQVFNVYTNNSGSAVSVGTMSIADGNVFTPSAVSGYALAVIDANGDTAGGVADDGALSFEAAELDTLNGRAVSDILAAAGPDSGVTHGYLGEINWVTSYGQSLSVGYFSDDSAPPISLTQPYDSVMLNSGQTAFVPLIEPATANGEGETPCSGAALAIKQLIASEDGMSPSDQSYVMAMDASGIPSAALGTLLSSIPSRVTGPALAAMAVSQAAGKVFNFPAFLWTQGESDLGINSGRYCDGMELIRSTIEADMVSGGLVQPNPIRMICYQTGSHLVYGIPYPTSAIGQLIAARTNPNVTMACPTYQFEYGAGNPHMRKASYKALGFYYGLAYKRAVIDGIDWKPLMPVSNYRQGKNLLVKFHVPHGRLVFDTTLVTAAVNKGFRIYGPDGAENTITAVAIVGKDTVKIAATSDIVDGSVLRYAFTNEGTNDAGRTTGARGNLRDTQGDAIVIDPSGLNYPMHNWCVMFEEAL